MELQRAMPVLKVQDVSRAAAYYETLGFFSHGLWGAPPSFAIIQRGQVTLALDRDREQSGKPTPMPWWSAYIYVDDADALHAEFCAQGIAELDEVGKRFYGRRDFDATDPDGNKLAFGQDLGPDGTKPGLAD